ncbi:MAG: MBL fold metallo-hydrolase, partial [bacterium]
MIAQLEFLGAAETVTGSKYLLTVGDYKLLVDCGLYQGASELKALNWMPLDVPPSEIDAVVLTHGHIDHIGYLPKLVKDGFKGPIFASPGTIDIALISLPDAAHLQEEDARYANKKGFSKHKP